MAGMELLYFLLTFINPELDPLGAGYQIIQSKTALGSGGLWGKGWGEGTQTQLKFLPVQESDFIVSVIGEELGFVALFVMIFFFSIFMYRILSLSLNASDKFSGLILIGISTIRFAITIYFVWGFIFNFLLYYGWFNLKFWTRAELLKIE